MPTNNRKLFTPPVPRANAPTNPAQLPLPNPPIADIDSNFDGDSTVIPMVTRTRACQAFVIIDIILSVWTIGGLIFALSRKPETNESYVNRVSHAPFPLTVAQCLVCVTSFHSDVGVVSQRSIVQVHQGAE
jgi:hypothetical protein